MDGKMRCYLVFGLLGLAASSLGAQPIYKCQSKRSIVYSDEPCLGGRTVDIAPTQGLDKASGQSRKGADVRRSETNRAMAEALQPIFGERAEQYEIRYRRFRLSANDRLECANLDARLPVQETAARDADKEAAAGAEAALFESRKRYRELRC